jgi:hypothetical protein
MDTIKSVVPKLPRQTKDSSKLYDKLDTLQGLILANRFKLLKSKHKDSSLKGRLKRAIPVQFAGIT